MAGLPLEPEAFERQPYAAFYWLRFVDSKNILAFSVYKVAIRQAEKSKVSRKRSIIVDCHAIKVRFRLNHKLSPLISVCLAGWMAVCAEDLHKPLATVCLFFMSHRATERQTESRKAFRSTLGFLRDSHRLEV